MNKKIQGIEIGRFFFACAIPLLHISFQSGLIIDFIRQYISRLGVPFFFVVSGMFLIKSIEKNGATTALKRYLIRIGRLFGVWLIIYLPIIYKTFDSVVSLLQHVMFLTPAYLWYLSGLLFASVPFCLIRNRKLLSILAIALYVLGTFFSGSYRWLINPISIYDKIFLTTRNGLFFGLPLMCIGELSWRLKNYKPYVFIIGLLLFFEIVFVGLHSGSEDDRSMYFLLPLFMLFFVVMLREWNVSLKSSILGGMSTAIYVMQFGIITISKILLRHIGIDSDLAALVTYLFVIVIPCALYFAFRKTRIIKFLF